MERIQTYFPGCKEAFITAIQASKIAYENEFKHGRHHFIIHSFQFGFELTRDFHYGDAKDTFWSFLNFLEKLHRGRDHDRSKALLYTDMVFNLQVRRSLGEINDMIVNWVMGVSDIAHPRWITHRLSPLVQLAQKHGVTPPEMCSKLIIPMIEFYYREMQHQNDFPYDDANYFIPPDYEDKLLAVIEVLLTHMQTPHRYLHLGVFGFYYATKITRSYAIGERLIALVTEKFNHLMVFRSFTAWFVVNTLDAIREELDSVISVEERQHLRRTAMDLKIWCFRTAEQQPDIIKGNQETPEAQAMLPLIEQGRHEQQAIQHMRAPSPEPFAMENID